MISRQEQVVTVGQLVDAYMLARKDEAKNAPVCASLRKSSALEFARLRGASSDELEGLDLVAQVYIKEMDSDLELL